MGSGTPAAACDFAKAHPKSSSMPITSPVDFISGPSNTSTPANLLNGKTASFTDTCLGVGALVNPSSDSLRPIMTLIAILARGTPIDLLTKGTVLDARGLTSSTYTWRCFTANCAFMRPTTPNSRAKAFV